MRLMEHVLGYCMVAGVVALFAILLYIVVVTPRELWWTP